MNYNRNNIFFYYYYVRSFIKGILLGIPPNLKTPNIMSKKYY